VQKGALFRALLQAYPLQRQGQVMNGSQVCGISPTANRQPPTANRQPL